MLQRIVRGLVTPPLRAAARPVMRLMSKRGMQSMTPANTPGVVNRGPYPPYVPLLGMPPPSNAGPVSLSVDQAIAINETVNSVLEYGLFVNERFKSLSALDLNPAVKFQLVMETLVEVQLYAALPYGFESSQKGFQDYTMAIGQMSQQVTDPNSEDAKELSQVFEETWEIAVKKVFGVDVAVRLSAEQVQVIAAKLSATMQDQKFLSIIEEKVKPLPLEQKQLAIEEHSYEAYLPIMEEYGFEGAGGFAQLKVELTHKMSDPQVQMNLFALQRAVASKAGLM